MEAHSLAAILSTEEIPSAVKGVYDYFGLMKAALDSLKEAH